ncbi:hypothetical protein HKD37_04G010376 [Glycine soja]
MHETHLLLEVAYPLSLPYPFRCHLSSKKQRNPLMKKILGLQAPMEPTSCEEEEEFSLLEKNITIELHQEKRVNLMLSLSIPPAPLNYAPHTVVTRDQVQERIRQAMKSFSMLSIQNAITTQFSNLGVILLQNLQQAQMSMLGAVVALAPRPWRLLSLSSFSISLPFIFQEAKESIDEEDPRPTSSNGAYIMWYQEHLHLGNWKGGLVPYLEEFESRSMGKHALVEVKLRFYPSSGGAGEEHVRRKIIIDMARCFGLGSVLVLAALAASMVVLPLMLPPLPPPPLVLLFFPVGIMAALMLLVFSPSDQNGVVYATTSFFHGLFPSGWRLLSPLLLCLPLHLHGGKLPLKDLIEAQRSSLHRSPTSKLPSSGNQSTRASRNCKGGLVSSLEEFESRSKGVNGEGTSHKNPLSRILDELSSLRLWKEKQERKEQGKKRVEEISQDERKKIREEERRKIMKEMKKEKHASYSSHNSCKSLSEELRDYYEGRHRSHLRPHSHRREKERKPQEANINLPYFHGKDNVEANLDWEIRVEQQLKKKSTSKSYGSHSYPKKDQGQGILGVTPSKPKDDKGKTIEKQAPKASMQEKTSSMKCFKCLGRGHITSQCPTTKTMIVRGQDIYSSQDEATTSPSSSESEEAKGEESSEEIYPQEEGQPLVVKEKCKEVSVSSKSLAKKETHFTINTNIKETFPLRQPPHFLFCKKTLVSTATPLGLEVIPQVKELLDEGLVRKILNPCALLVLKIGVEGRSPEYEEPRDLRSNPFQGGGDDAILPRKGIG